MGSGEHGGRGPVVVVGSANVDRTVRVARLPAPGETVTGSSPAVAPGGKGLNQAVAAARMGATVVFVGALGDDDDGRLLRRRLSDEHVLDATVTVDQPTGGATITVDDAAENTIVVSQGANGAVDASVVAAAIEHVEGAAVLLTQLEVPVEAVTATLRRATGIRILTPAPVQPLGRDVLDHVDVLVPNRGELVALTGGAAASDGRGSGDDDAGGRGRLVAAARSLDVPTVVVTLGADGVLVVRGDDATHVPALGVEAVDTVGAGDTFSGALAATLARGDDLLTAVDVAVAAAALSVTGHGAQEAMPTRDQVRGVLGDGSDHRDRARADGTTDDPADGGPDDRDGDGPAPGEDGAAGGR